MPSASPVCAVVFDFDGVILESMDVKTRAFETLFAPEGPRAVSAIVAHHKAHGGISRFEKFRHAYREILNRPLSARDEKALGEKFNVLVEDAVVESKFVPGAREFLEKYSSLLGLYVASGAPEEELRRIVARRALTRYFHDIYGTPATKSQILMKIASGLGRRPETITMVGDAMSDYEGAKKAGTRFVGRVRPGDQNPFPSGVVILPDLTGLAGALAIA